MYQTNMYEGMLAETVMIHSANGEVINAYYARPLVKNSDWTFGVNLLPGW